MEVYFNPYKDYKFKKRPPIRWSKVKPFTKNDLKNEMEVCNQTVNPSQSVKLINQLKELGDQKYTQVPLINLHIYQ